MSDIEDLYQETIIDHTKNPRNKRTLENYSHSAEGYNPLCGDHVYIYAQVNEEQIITDISFEGEGCSISIASASLMTESLKGKTLEEAKEVFKNFHSLATGSTETEKEGLGKLEVFSNICRYPVRVKCATLAWHTVNDALKNKEKEND